MYILTVTDFTIGKVVTRFCKESLLDCAVLYARNYNREERTKHSLNLFEL